MKPIETSYAGCRFRSRLEARWAVAFDHLRIRWEYEPQGFECEGRLTDWAGSTRFPYLPDFWLPDFSTYVEVKAAMSESELVRLCDAAADLSEAGTPVLLLGPTPDPRTMRAPWQMHLRKGLLYAETWHPHDDGQPCSTAVDLGIAHDTGYGPTWRHIRWGDMEGSTAAKAVERLLAGSPTACPRWDAACIIARSARFEHGESGTPVRSAPADVCAACAASVDGLQLVEDCVQSLLGEDLSHPLNPPGVYATRAAAARSARRAHERTDANDRTPPSASPEATSVICVNTFEAADLRSAGHHGGPADLDGHQAHAGQPQCTDGPVTA
jgi:hypothetical protein